MAKGAVELTAVDPEVADVAGTTTTATTAMTTDTVEAVEAYPMGEDATGLVGAETATMMTAKEGLGSCR